MPDPHTLNEQTTSGFNALPSCARQKSEPAGCGLSSRPEEFHLRALPEPCMTLSSHTAPDVRP